MSDARKRPFDGEDDGSKSKRFNNGQPVVKFLVPNHLAGKLIGKGGSALSDIQANHNVSIRISPSKEYYPGTSDRVVCVMGEIDNMIEFGNFLICSLEINKDPPDEFKLLISNDAAGYVIGKGGAQSKSITESSGAKLSMDKKGENLTGERVLRVLGDQTQIVSAYKHLMDILNEIKEKISDTNLTYPIHQRAYSNGETNPISNMGTGIQIPKGYQPRTPYRVKFSAELEIPDELVGAVIGKGGQTAMEIKRNTGAKLQFTKKDDYVDGTTNRLLTITGDNIQQVENAYIMVDQILPLEFGN